jgi:hypothetical protein
VCSKHFADEEEVETELQKWLKQNEKLLLCGFQRTNVAMGQVYRCLWRICREINVFPRFEYHMFYVLYPYAISLLTFFLISSKYNLKTLSFNTKFIYIILIHHNLNCHILRPDDPLVIAIKSETKYRFFILPYCYFIFYDGFLNTICKIV